MKNFKILIAVFGLSLLLFSCKGSKCDCPSFKPKSEVQKPILDQNWMGNNETLFA